MVFDPSVPKVERDDFPCRDWDRSIYGDIEEEMPPNMPKPMHRGRRFVMRAYVDSDHVGDSVTRRSCTGFCVFLNEAPIYWMSKKQTCCETSTFGSEFIAMTHDTSD